jgi:hypothetical protein
MLISIGNSCTIRHHIDIYNNYKLKTNIFDWVLVNIECVCIILKYYNNFNLLFNIDNISKDGNHENNSKIIVKLLDYLDTYKINKPYFISYHDVKIKYTKKDIYEFIEKYKRRLERLINIIQTSTEIIYFIHYGIINDVIKNDFIKIINKINNNCNFKLCSLYDDNDDIIEPNLISINMTKYLISEKDNNWKKNYYDWKSVLNFIVNNK